MGDRRPATDGEGDIDRIAAALGRSPTWVASMLVDRRGDRPGSNMTTIGLHAVVGPDRSHRCTIAGLARADGAVDADGADGGGPTRAATRLDGVAGGGDRDRPPPHLVVRATWAEEGDAANQGDRGAVASADNLLGPSVRFRLDGPETDLVVPLVDAGDHQDALHHYGAQLVRVGEIVTFAEADYPIWVVEYGPHYVDHYLLGDRGGGFYLEWHADRPHWHQPLSADAGGFYLLARRLGPTARVAEYRLTAFRLPPGTAVYTSPGAIHCDAALTGTWAVGYADSDHFSTALVRDRQGRRVRITPSPADDESVSRYGAAAPREGGRPPGWPPTGTGRSPGRGAPR